MMLDTSGMSEFQQQYWMARQKEIVQIHESRKLRRCEGVKKERDSWLLKVDKVRKSGEGFWGL
ncbi:hypothetical protein FH972_015209 [Carpinus fangiana]|uniref:Uncharacterized protein n=1 Tax=Carpinus fangiana TaxID=176857 RepID=A0A5N6RCN0_9ROSI|nr:hypothetical protein FH972_015209 [Carpinus fangiana]